MDIYTPYNYTDAWYEYWLFQFDGAVAPVVRLLYGENLKGRCSDSTSRDCVWGHDNKVKDKHGRKWVYVQSLKVKLVTGDYLRSTAELGSSLLILR